MQQLLAKICDGITTFKKNFLSTVLLNPVFPGAAPRVDDEVSRGVYCEEEVREGDDVDDEGRVLAVAPLFIHPLR